MSRGDLGLVFHPAPPPAGAAQKSYIPTPGGEGGVTRDHFLRGARHGNVQRHDRADAHLLAASVHTQFLLERFGIEGNVLCGSLSTRHVPPSSLKTLALSYLPIYVLSTGPPKKAT